MDMANYEFTWDSAEWDDAQWAKYSATWDNAVWDSSNWNFSWGGMLYKIIAELEKHPSENFWETGFWTPGFWDECRLLRGIIREIEK